MKISNYTKWYNLPEDIENMFIKHGEFLYSIGLSDYIVIDVLNDLAKQWEERYG